MRWLLIEPPARSAIRNSIGAVGIPSSAYLAPILRREDEEVRIEDAPTLNHDLDDVEKEIRKYDPDYVGISAMTPTMPIAYEVARTVKEFDSDIKVITGGPHPTLSPERTLEECSAVDIVVRGEGEETIRELAEGRDLADIRGVTFREDGEIVRNEGRDPIMDLNSLPFPAYDMLPMDKYRTAGVQYSTLMTSRGCPFNCIFCSSSEICGKMWRGKSPRRVLEQLKLLTRDFGVCEIEFLDDTFTLNRDRTESICNLIVEERLNISWSCSSRADTIDGPLAEKLREAGCHTVYIGIESGTQKILDRLEKWMDPEDFESYEGVMFDFDTYLADLPEEPPWSGSKRKGEGFSYRSRIQALSAAKLYLQLMYGARLDRDVDEFVSGEKPEFSPEYYEKEEVEEIFEKTKNCTYPHCHVMTRLGYDCILRCAELVQVCKEDIDLSKRVLEVRAVKRSIPREVQFSGETAGLLEPIMEDRESGHLFLTYETEGREGVKPFEPESWSRHFRREHDAKFHKLARHSSIIHKLQDGWIFGDVYLQARHQHPSMTAKYAEFAGIEAPDWAEESPF